MIEILILIFSVLATVLFIILIHMIASDSDNYYYWGVRRMIFAKRLKKLRKEKGLTQKEVAKHFDITRPTYQEWEDGKCSPSGETLIILADYFDVSIDYLVGRKEENTEHVLKLQTDNEALKKVLRETRDDIHRRLTLGDESWEQCLGTKLENEINQVLEETKGADE